MTCVIQLVETAAGIPSDQEGGYVVEYDPPSMNEHGNYNPDGRLMLTKDIAHARRFPDPAVAFEFWRQQNGLRPDGKPNRPLVAWTIEVVDLDETH